MSINATSGLCFGTSSRASWDVAHAQTHWYPGALSTNSTSILRMVLLSSMTAILVMGFAQLPAGECVSLVRHLPEQGHSGPQQPRLRIALEESGGAEGWS